MELDQVVYMSQSESIFLAIVAGILFLAFLFWAFWAYTKYIDVDILFSFEEFHSRFEALMAKNRHEKARNLAFNQLKLSEIGPQSPQQIASVFTLCAQTFAQSEEAIPTLFCALAANALFKDSTANDNDAFVKFSQIAEQLIKEKTTNVEPAIIDKMRKKIDELKESENKPLMWLKHREG